MQCAWWPQKMLFVQTPHWPSDPCSLAKAEVRGHVGYSLCSPCHIVVEEAVTQVRISALSRQLGRPRHQTCDQVDEGIEAFASIVASANVARQSARLVSVRVACPLVCDTGPAIGHSHGSVGGRRAGTSIAEAVQFIMDAPVIGLGVGGRSP